MLSMSIKGLKEVTASFKKVETRLNKRKEMNKKAVVIIDRWIQKNFQSEGKAVGGWAKLKPSTEASRRKGKKGGRHRILQDTGHLRSRWEHHAKNDAAIVKSKVDYGVYHDSSEPRKGKLKRRQIAPDFKHVENPLSKLFESMIGKAVKDGMK